jgi:hypothetical protein
VCEVFLKIKNMDSSKNKFNSSRQCTLDLNKYKISQQKPWKEERKKEKEKEKEKEKTPYSSNAQQYIAKS